MAKKILIVDNDEDFTKSVSDNLVKNEYEVVVAEDSQKALELFDSAKPDLVMSEVMLEHNDSGFALCYHLKQKSPNVPILLVSDIVRKTGFCFDASTAYEKEWIKADEFINKPVNQAYLTCVIGKHLHHKK